MQRRQLNFLAAALLASGYKASRAQGTAKPRYGVLSLIGRQVKVVTAQPTTGSHLDQNIQDPREISTDVFDLEALRVIQSSLGVVDPDGGQVLLYKSVAGQVDRSADLFDGNKVTLPPDQLATMKADGATRLLLLTRHRQEAELKAQHSRIGGGRLEGLGFYVNYHQRMRRSDTGEVGVGWIAPYVYLRLSLVDLETGTLLATQNIRGSRTVAASRAEDSVNPWDALTTQQKLDALVRMLDHELRAAVPKVLAAASAPGPNA